MPKGKMKMNWSKAPSNLDVEGVKRIADREDSISKTKKRTEDLTKRANMITGQKFSKGTKGIDATDESFEKPTPNKPELVKLNDVPVREAVKENPLKSIEAPHTDEMRKVATWQRKRGLEADGVWGDKTKARYEDEQSGKVAKPTVSRKTMNTSIVKSNTVSPIGSSKAPAKTNSKVNFESSNDGVTSAKDWHKPTAPMGRSEQERVDAANVQARRFQDPETGNGGFGISEKTAKTLNDIDKKGDEKTMSVASKVGLGGAALVAVGAGIGVHRALKGKNPIGSSKKLITAAEEVVGGKLVKPSLTQRISQRVAKNVKMVAPENPDIKARNVASAKANAAMSKAERDANPDFIKRQEVISNFEKNGKASEKAATGRKKEVIKKAGELAEKKSYAKANAAIPSKDAVQSTIAAASTPKTMNTKKVVDKADAAMTAANRYTQPKRDQLKSLNSETSFTNETLPRKKARGRQKATKNMPVVKSESQNRGLLLGPAKNHSEEAINTIKKQGKDVATMKAREDNFVKEVTQKKAAMRTQKKVLENPKKYGYGKQHIGGKVSLVKK